MGQADQNEAARVHGFAVAAALTVLATSVGVNVQELVAADAPDRIQSNQIQPAQGQVKIDSTQSKLQTQQKLPSTQHKLPVQPGVKPIDPIR